jgi:hypothetical protein
MQSFGAHHAPHYTAQALCALGRIFGAATPLGALVYYNKINTTIEVTPAQAVEYEHEDDYSNVINSVKDKAIKPSPFQNSYAEGQVVRLRIPKGQLDKFDKPNWSEQKYTITTVLQQSEYSTNHTSAKPKRYKITPFGGREQSVRYVRESLLAIPPILKPPKKSTPPLPPLGLDGYTVNTAVLLHGYDVSVDFLSNLWRQVHVG